MLGLRFLFHLQSIHVSFVDFLLPIDPPELGFELRFDYEFPATSVTIWWYRFDNKLCYGNYSVLI